MLTQFIRAPFNTLLSTSSKICPCALHEGMLGIGDIAPYICNLRTRYKWVISFTSWPFYPHGKTFQYPLNRTFIGQELAWTMWRKASIPRPSKPTIPHLLSIALRRTQNGLVFSTFPLNIREHFSSSSGMICVSHQLIRSPKYLLNKTNFEENHVNSTILLLNYFLSSI